ncbi:hypothetical protein QVD17_13173 [Tagetes erecta]|uniref:Uncharacterized protein n=1 Tax=Tagetes erecta TaxID=13708 RepID=A0AAD8KWH3_TARER|nr:hypothetical protein QVD17_13173 [Tagetes erecta]
MFVSSLYVVILSLRSVYRQTNFHSISTIQSTVGWTITRVSHLWSSPSSLILVGCVTCKTEHSLETTPDYSTGIYY